MKKKSVIGILVLLVVLIAVYFLFIEDNREDKLMRQGNELVEQVESFREQHGRLPSSLSEMGIEESESGPLYYQKEDSLDYIIYFGTSLGESKTYHSDTEKWEGYDR